MDERYVPCTTSKSKGHTNEWEESKCEGKNDSTIGAGGESEDVDKERGLRVFLFVAGSLSKW